MRDRYRKGRIFEYRVKNYLEGRGYFVVRQARSAFPDLIALKRGLTLLVECRVDGEISKEEKERLLVCAERAGGRPILAFRKKRGREILFKSLISRETLPSDL